MGHRHRPKTTVDRCYTGPVKQPENRAAHGNITREDTCSCGAVRFTNINGMHIERGPWRSQPSCMECVTMGKACRTHGHFARPERW